MGIKINQYPLERLTFGDDDYYDIDYWNGSTFETAKIKGSTIKNAITSGLVDTNLFSGNLNASQNIEQETDQYTWRMKKSNQGASQIELSYGLDTNEWSVKANSSTDNLEQKMRELYNQTRVWNTAGVNTQETNINQLANSVALNAIELNDTTQLTLAPTEILLKHNDATVSSEIRMNDQRILQIFDEGIFNAVMRLTASETFLAFFNTISGQFSDFRGTANEIKMAYDDGNGQGAILQISGTDHYFSDAVNNPKGLQYGGNYHTSYVLRSLVDKEYVDLAIASVSGSNLFTANLNLLTNRLHTLNDKSIQFDLASATGNSGNWKITNSSIGGYLYDTSSGGLNYTTVNQQANAIILTAESSTSTSPHVLGINGNAILASVSNYGFTLDEQFNFSKFYGENGVIQIGSTTINTNTFYKDNSTNKYGILYKDFGETSEIDATGANYSTLVGTSLVPKKYVDDAIPILTKTITIQDPQTNDNITIFRTDRDITVQEVVTVSTGSGASTQYYIAHSTNRSSLGSNLVNLTTSTNTTTGDIPSLLVTSIPANSWVYIDIGTVAGTNVYFSVDIRFTQD